MAFSTEQRRALLQADLPDSDNVRLMLDDYLKRTGLSYADFGARINYSRVTLIKFASGSYAHVSSNDRAIRKEIVDFIAQHPVAGHHAPPGKLYETENVRILRKYFHEALERGRAYYVEGDPGTQKSFVLQHLVAELNQRELSKNGHGRRAYYVYCPEQVSRHQFMKIIAEACGSPSRGDIHRIVRNLRFDFMQRRVLLVLDEAQHLKVECLETVRELYDLPPHFGLLFAGSHQLERMFRVNALQLEQWNSRFHAGQRLPGLTAAEASEIVRAELGSSIKKETIDKLVGKCRAVVTASKGEHQYISARRLFETIHDLQEKVGERRKAATA